MRTVNVRAFLACGFLLTSGWLQAQTATTTTLTSIAPAAALFGQVVTLTAQVSPAAPGTVTFEDRGVLVGVGPLNGSGVAAVSTISLPAGSHSIQAIYGGGGGFQPSQSAVSTYSVTALPGGGFDAPVNYVGGTPNLPDGSVAVADFNGDGKADLAVANWNNPTTSGNLAVLLGNGNGTFQPPAGYPIGAGNSFVAAGDFNGDGTPDLVVVTTADNNVSVFLGNGDGTFRPAAGHASAGGTTSTFLAVGDLNGDGKLDVVVANANQFPYIGNISVLLGNGDGTFQAPVSYAGTSYISSVAIGDFNGDGKPDLVYAESNYVSVLLGNGDGTFQAPIHSIAGVQPTVLAVGDLNGDGTLDLAVTDFYSRTVNVLMGRGDGVFALMGQYAVGSSPSFVAIGDLDGDGQADLAVTNQGQSNNLNVLLGNGDGSFQAAVTYGQGILSGPNCVVLADFDGNGVADMVVGNFFTGDVTVFLGWPLKVNPPAVYLDSTAQFGPELSVTASPTFTWATQAGAPWISLTSGASGTGNGDVTYSVTANATGYVRSNSISIAAQTVPVTQRATATVFTDVGPLDYYFDFTNALYATGITSGCLTSPLEYCPNDTITRAEMAVYLVVGIEGNSNFSYTTTPYFTDVSPSDPFFKFIQKLRDLGITGGCSATQFCPDNPVTRAEMAVFVILSRYETTPYTYPLTPYFTDVPSSSAYFPFVQKMAQSGITAGCGGGLYCPNTDVTRGQMAVFIVTGLLNELLPPGAPVLASAAPNTAAAGQSVTVTLTGTNTHFVQGITQVTAAPGIAVSNVTIISATSLTVQLDLGADIAANPTSIVAATGTEEAVLPNGFVVTNSFARRGM